jgi:hypothetical protein
MRWFLILAAATAAIVFANPTPAKAQFILGGAPTYSAPFSGTLLPGGTGLIPFANGGPVELALNRALWNMAASGSGPFANYFSPLGGPRYFAAPFAGNPNGFGALRPLTVPANPGRWGVPQYGNPGLHRGWFKGGGKGKGKGR